MQNRTQATNVALIVIGVIVAGLLLFSFLNRGPDTASLTGRTWQLASITGQTPAFQGVIPAAEQPLYTIAFAADGTFAARADCNALAGTYTLDRGDGMTITPGPSTLVACPDGSYGSLFAHALATVTTWAITVADLTLTTVDGGTGTFVDGADAPVVPTATASTPPSSSPSASPSAEPTPSASPSDEPTASPTPSPTASPSPTPTAEPTATPTPSPTPPTSAAPTATPTATPTAAPTAAPTATPTPTAAPTEAPTPAPTPTPTPTPSATPPPGADLVGTSWQLASFTTRDPVAGADVPADQRAKYTVSFVAGGTFSATADCNVVTGTWTATAAGGLSIVPGPSAIVPCEDGSYGDLYVLALTNSASYAIANAGLTITLEEGGTLVYEPGR